MLKIQREIRNNYHLFIMLHMWTNLSYMWTECVDLSWKWKRSGNEKRNMCQTLKVVLVWIFVFRSRFHSLGLPHWVSNHQCPKSCRVSRDTKRSLINMIIHNQSFIWGLHKAAPRRRTNVRRSRCARLWWCHARWWRHARGRCHARGSAINPCWETLGCIRWGRGRVERGRRGAELWPSRAGVVELSRLDGRDSHVAIDLL